MDLFKQTAAKLGLTPSELVAHIVKGRFTTDKLTEEGIVKHVMQRFEEYNVLPDYVLDYCQALGRIALDWSLAQAEGAVAGHAA